MNSLERVTTELQKKIVRVNLNVDLYGMRSQEYRICQISVNEYLEALENCGYIDTYYFEYEETNRDRIYYLSLDMGDFTCRISEKTIEFDVD